MTIFITYAALVGACVRLIRISLFRQAPQTLVAKALRIHNSTYSRIERGTSAFTIEQLAQVARELQVRPYEILKFAQEAQWALEERGVIVVFPGDKEPMGTPFDVNTLPYILTEEGQDVPLPHPKIIPKVLPPTRVPDLGSDPLLLKKKQRVLDSEDPSTTVSEPSGEGTPDLEHPAEG